jgi:hypothetical protein
MTPMEKFGPNGVDMAPEPFYAEAQASLAHSTAGSQARVSSERHAACSCGQLRLRVSGDPVRVSICHCLACQRRTGSAFGFQARFRADRVEVTGRSREFLRASDEGENRTFRFCPECGATVFYTTAGAPELIAIPIGAFADPDFPAPAFSVWERRMHVWVQAPQDSHRSP